MCPLLSRTLALPRSFSLTVALTDLLSDIERSGGNFGVDDSTEHGLVEQVLALMQDANGEVKNLAVKA